MTDNDARSIAELGLTIDLRAEPWHYPGPFLPFSCLQDGDLLHPLTHGAVLDGPHFVVAIGSNASPDVMRRKFARRGVSTRMHHVVGRLDGFALGYSAHVSLAGYVPVTFYPRAGTSTSVVLSTLTDEQLTCLDETEPNYNRVTVPDGRVELTLPVSLPDTIHVYESKWGFLVDEAGDPIPFGTQETVHGHLASWGLLPATLDTHQTARLLAADADLRQKITTALGVRSHRLPAG